MSLSTAWAFSLWVLTGHFLKGRVLSSRHQTSPKLQQQQSIPLCFTFWNVLLMLQFIHLLGRIHCYWTTKLHTYCCSWNPKRFCRDTRFAYTITITEAELARGGIQVLWMQALIRALQALSLVKLTSLILFQMKKIITLHCTFQHK